jgi:hypothetical protein
METFDRKKVDALNTEKYEAVPILEYLTSLNKRPESSEAVAPPPDPVQTPPQPAAEISSPPPAENNSTPQTEPAPVAGSLVSEPQQASEPQVSKPVKIASDPMDGVKWGVTVDGDEWHLQQNIGSGGTGINRGWYVSKAGDDPILKGTYAGDSRKEAIEWIKQQKKPKPQNAVEPEPDVDPADIAAVEEAVEEARQELGLPKENLKLVSEIVGGGQAARESGASGQPQKMAGATIGKVAYVAMSGSDPKSATYHEGFHVIENAGLIEPDEMTVFEKENDRLRKGLAGWWGMTEESVSQLSPKEVRAYGFQQYRQNRDEGKQTPGLLPAMRRAFDRIYRFLRRVGNGLQRRGFQTSEDIFDRVLREKRGAKVKDTAASSPDFMVSAFHGSPHSFDRFSLEKINTGEGAQVYGYGLYFADKKEVAEHYRSSLSQQFTFRGKPIDTQTEEGLEAFSVGQRMQKGASFEEARQKEVDDVKARIQTLQNYIDTESDPAAGLVDAQDEIALWQRHIDALAGMKESDFDFNTGKVYEVRLSPDEDSFLLWDKPLAEQSESVREKLSAAGFGGGQQFTEETFPASYKVTGGRVVNEDGRFFLETGDAKFRLLWDDVMRLVGEANQGSRIYQELAQKLGSDKAASDALREAGIPGIKYLDGNSRDVTPPRVEEENGRFVVYWGNDPTPVDAFDTRAEAEAAAKELDTRAYNYVIFDDSLIEIVGQYATDPRQQDEAWVEEIKKRYGDTVTLDEMNQARGPLHYAVDQVRGTAAQEAVLDRIVSVDDRTTGQRIREGIADFKANALRRLRQGLFDQFDSIGAYEKAANSGQLLDATMSAYKAARLTQNLGSTMHVMLKRGMIDYRNGEFVPVAGFDGGFEGIFNDLAKRGLLRLWQGWAIANRAQRLLQEGRENLLSQADVNALLPLEQQYPEFRQVLDRWQAYNKAVLDMAQHAGVIDPTARALWERYDYVPFYRVLQDDDVAGPHTKKGLANQKSGVRKLRGGEAAINDLIENMVMNITHLVDASFKNVASTRAVKFAAQAGAVEAVPMDWQVAHVTPEKLATMLEDIGVQVSGLTPQQHAQWLKLFTMKPPAAKNVISVLVNGKAKYYRVDDPMLMSALTNMTPKSQDLLTKMMGGAKTLLTRSVTSFPEFMIANAIRDSVASWVVTGGKTSPLKAAVGFVKSLREAPSRIEIAAAGGGTAGYYDTTPADVRKQLEVGHGKAGLGKRAWEAWMSVGQASENMNRIALYETLRKQGASHAEAAYQAMDLLDFAMRGDFAAVRWLTSVVPFLNARLQGLYKLGRAAAKNPKGFVLRGSVISMAALALAAQNEGEDWYEELPEWERDTYFHIKLPDGTRLRIPKPFEVGVVFGTLPERILRAYNGTDSGRKSWEAARRAFLDTFAMDPTPQLVKPILEQYANKVAFTGAPIVTQGLERLRPGEQVKESTSGLAEGLGKLFPDHVSPVRVDALMRGYLGTLGGGIAGVSSALRDAVDPTEAPTRRLEDYPVMGRFLREDPIPYSRWVDDFYELRDEATKVVASAKHLAKQGRSDEAKKIIAANPKAPERAKMMDKAAKKLSDISREMRSIRANKKLSADQKRKKLDDLMRARNQIARQMVKQAGGR